MEHAEFLDEAIARRARLLSCLDDMEAYRAQIASGFHADFEHPPAAHHRIIQKEIEALVEGDEYDALLIMAPPGSAKSTYGSVQAATWYWARHPTHKVLAVSNTTSLAEDFARRRRSVCEMAEWAQVARCELDKSQINITGFANTRGGMMYARGVGSSIAGLRCNLLICDDLIASFEEANSVGQLDKIWEWYGTDARTRLVPTGKEVMIMTRWSRQDPAGRILERIEKGEEPKRWKIVRLPMLCDDPENDPLGREKDEPLWPEWFSEAQIADNISHPLRWPALYQQVPVDASGTWVDPEYIQIIDVEDLPSRLSYRMATDIALTAGAGDDSVIGVGAIDDDRNLYVLDMWREQVAPNRLMAKLQAMNSQFKPPYVLIDDDPAAKMFVESMKEYARNGGDPPVLKPLPIAGKDKEYRAAPVRDLFMQKRVYFVRAAWNAWIIQQMMTFPPKSKTEKDDGIDVLGLLGRDMWTNTVPQDHPEQIVKPVEGAYIQREGKQYTRHTLDDLWPTKRGSRFDKLRI